MTLEIRLLGPPTFSLSGQPLQLVRRKSIGLLAWLAVTGRGQSRDAVIGLLWPEFDRESALMNLRRDLSWLRKLLGDDFLRADRLEIAIELDAPLWVDVREFDAALRAAQKHNHPGSTLCPECAAHLNQATALYQGELMAGFSLADSSEYEEWLFFEREERRAVVAGALEKLTGWSESQGNFSEGIGAARRWLNLDPWHEVAHRALMRLYALDNQPTAALRQYELCRKALADELGAEPEAETSALYEAIRARRLTPATPARPTPAAIAPPPLPAPVQITGSPPAATLPLPPFPLIGRGREVEEISRLLRGEARLVTLVAPGGMGKTHLSLVVAAGVADAFPDGVYFAPLASIAQPEHIYPALVQSLQLPAGGDPASLLRNYLADKRLLLVLDNCEHLLSDDGGGNAGGIAAVAQTLLQTAPGLRLLATCRERLNLQSEVPHTLGGLSLAGESGASESSAARLFVECALRVHPSLALDEDTWRVVQHICRLVEGMPLALILAANWADMLSLAEIAEEVSRDLDFLETDMADMPARQRSIRAIFDGSWRRLSGEEQTVFCRLSVFQGGFTRQAAQAVAGASLRDLRTLTHRALMSVDGKGRCQIHGLLRQYGAEKLVEVGGEARTRNAHADYFMELLHRCEEQMQDKGQMETVAEIEHEFENVRNAWDWAVERHNRQGIDRGLDGLRYFLEISGRSPEAIVLLTQAVSQFTPRDRAESTLLWGRIAVRLATLRLVVAGDTASIESLITECLQIAEISGNQREMAFCYYLSGTYAGFFQHNFEAAVAIFQQAVAIFQSSGDRIASMRVLSRLGLLYYNQGRPEARSQLIEALALARMTGQLTVLASLLNTLCEVALVHGEYGRAEEYVREVLDPKVGRGDHGVYAKAMLSLCLILRGELVQAAQLLNESHQEAQRYDFVISSTYSSALICLCACLRGDYTTARQQADKGRINPTGDPLGQILGHWAMATVHVLIAEWTAAYSQLRLCIGYIQRLHADAIVTWLLPLTIPLLVWAERPEQAVHHLALAHIHPMRPPDWLPMWTHLDPLRAQLEVQMGSIAFARAWEVGTSLSIEDAMDHINTLAV